MASGSWDKKIRLSELYSKDHKTDILEHNSDITEIAFRPDGKELCSATLKGEIYLWSVEDGYLFSMNLNLFQFASNLDRHVVL